MNCTEVKTYFIKLLHYIHTFFKLGIGSVFYVAWYRLTLKTGIRKQRFKPRRFLEKSDFFKDSEINMAYPEEWKKQLVDVADEIISGRIRYFSYHWREVGNLPNWFLNPFNGAEFPKPQQHWTFLPDFHPSVGDIKNVWEASRFDWVVALARAYSVTGEKRYLITLNLWLKNWTHNNPLNIGPNWKCGQETSIRLFNLLNAAYILNQHKDPSPSLLEFVEASLARISKNIRYAIAQNNNHGTSESSALYIGGLWLEDVSPGRYPNAKYYAKKGKRWLENRVEKLISDSGSFSQHSVNYHRVVLDTLSFSEFWRRTLNGKPFSTHFYQKCKAAAYWQFQLSDSQSGGVPNLGSNDGALFLNTHSCDYLDFRPSLQMAARLFYDVLWFEDGLHNESLFWFNLNNNQSIKTPSKENLSLHGYATINNPYGWALIKWPYYKFRPSHNDSFHLDIWHKGVNIICDSGTFSYNPGADFSQDLKSVHFHNTVNFDRQEQMPKLSRFLMAKWIKTEKEGFIGNSKNEKNSWCGSYTDSNGNHHTREVGFQVDKWFVKDTLSGRFKEAIIGFNLNTTECTIKNNLVKTSHFAIETPEGVDFQTKDSWGSLYYHEIHSIKRLEILINKPGTYITIIDVAGKSH